MNKVLCKRGFSLAEMLVVLLVISVIAAAAVPLAHKRFKVNKAKAVHGKYICYRGPSDELHELEYQNNAIIRADAIVGSCTFTPSAKASYFIVQAIGGGGGGAYAGTIPARDTSPVSSGSISIPTNGNITLPSDAPSWLQSDFDAAAITVTGTVYGGGGGGGNGNGSFAWAYGDSQTTCDPHGGVANNTIVGCRWQTATTTRGSNGGRGGSCSRSTSMYVGMPIAASSGNGGAHTTAGGGGSLTLGALSCNAGGGGAGVDATPTIDGSPAGSDAVNPAVAGGTGGYGYNSGGNSPGTSVNQGTPGSYSAPSVQQASSPYTSVPYTYGYHTRRLAYGEKGYAGTYQNMFFTKLPTGLSINPGVGGAAGTSGSPSGSNGGNSTVGVLTATGGLGGTAQKLTPVLSLYSIVNSGNSYVATVLASVSPAITSTYSSPTLAVSGESGGIGGFYALQEVSSEGLFDPFSIYNEFGNGGDGGGSSVCIGYSVSKSLNGVNSTQTGGSGSCQTAGNDSAYDTSYAGSKGKGGAIVIIW